MNHVAILGAGIMGAATALRLARRGVRVSLLDQAPEPFTGASRWNEGKIHLGYLYAADPSLATARRVLPGGLAFGALIEDLLGQSIAPAVSTREEVYAIHRDSVVGIEAAGTYYGAVSRLVAHQGGRTGSLGTEAAATPRRLSRVELEGSYDTGQVVAAFRVAERSVITTWIADRFVAALAAEPRIEPRMGVRVTGVRRGAVDGPFMVETAAGLDGPYDAVVNALWEGRLAVDATLGLAPPPTWSHRFRLSAFVATPHAVDVPSTVVATGPFGDIKNYNDRDLYLSWYPAGLLADGTDVVPPAVPAVDDQIRARLLDDIVEQLGSLVPAVRALPPFAAARVAGGWVYAAGRGSLADPGSTLHRRDRVGIQRSGRYISVDTGKYSLAPWLAREVVDALL